MAGACVSILASRWWQATKSSGKDEAVDYNWLMEFKKTYSASKPVEQQSFIYISSKPTDMRNGREGLAGIVREVMGHNL